MSDEILRIYKSTLTGIANAIRTKNPDVTGLVDPADMEQDILDIHSGGGEPYIPMKQLISEFDFKGSNPYYDKVKNMNITTLMRGLTYSQGVGITATARGNKLRTGTNFDYAGIYETEIKFGTFDRTTALTNGSNMLLKVGRNSAKLMLNYYYNSSADTGKWWIHDQSGNNIYLDYGENDPYYFENKTLIMTYGAKYVDGELVRDQNKGYFYVNGVQLNSNGSAITGDEDSQVQVVFLCDSGNNAFIGAVYESLKIWEYRYNLDDTDDIIQPLTITANGTYTANGNTIAGYSPITVNVHEVLESEWDLLHSGSTLGFLDIVKNVSLPTDAYSGFSNGYITDRNCSVAMHKPNHGDVKRIVVKTGEFDRSQEPNEEWLNLMRLNTNDWHFNLTYNTSGDYWRVSDATGSTIDIPASTLPKYAFEDTTFEIVYGAKYINGELCRGIKTNGAITENYTNRLYVYLNGNLVMENPYQEIYPTIRVCGGNGWIGAKIENVKIYNVLDCYDKYYEAPVSLMSASPSEQETE